MYGSRDTSRFGAVKDSGVHESGSTPGSAPGLDPGFVVWRSTVRRSGRWLASVPALDPGFVVWRSTDRRSGRLAGLRGGLEPAGRWFVAQRAVSESRDGIDLVRAFVHPASGT